MNEEPDPKPPTPDQRDHEVRDRLLRMAIYAAPTILTLQGTAYALTEAPSQIIIDEAPVLDQMGLAALGTALATAAAYRLMRARRRATRSQEKNQES